MVRVVDEDVVALRGPEHGALRGLFVARQHRQELRGRDIGTCVRRLASMIHVLAVGLVEDLARDRVLRGVRDVVVHEQDDLLLGDALALGDLVGVAGVGLVAVVAVAVGPASNVVTALEIFEADAARLPGDDDGPVVLPGTLRQHEGRRGG